MSQFTNAEEMALFSADIHFIQHKINAIADRARQREGKGEQTEDARLADQQLDKIDRAFNEIYKKHGIEFEWFWDETIKKEVKWIRRIKRQFILENELF